MCFQSPVRRFGLRLLAEDACPVHPVFRLLLPSRLAQPVIFEYGDLAINVWGATNRERENQKEYHVSKATTRLTAIYSVTQVSTDRYQAATRWESPLPRMRPLHSRLSPPRDMANW